MRWLTGVAIKLRLSANAVSVLSVVFALGSAAAMVGTLYIEGWLHRGLWLAGAIGIELRALCNLLDGMVAVRTGTASPVGELYNEVPDRLSDIAMLAGFGYAIGRPGLGWAAACAAVLVAYVRAQAAAAGAGQDYVGPMAKPVRMQLVAVGCLLQALIPYAWRPTFWGPVTNMIHGPVHAYSWLHLPFILWVILIGCLVTVIRRLMRASRSLKSGVH